METTEGRIAGANGGLRIGDMNLHDQLDKGVIQAEVLSVPTSILGKDGNDDPINFLTDPRYMWLAFYPGLPYPVEIGHKITDVQLTSGSIVCY